MWHYPRFCTFFALLIFGMGAATPGRAQSNDQNVEAAEQAAQEWLTLIDKGEHAASWEAAAPLFQSKVTKEQWAQQARQARSQLDSLASRSLVAARYTTSLPNVPKGEYVVIQYRTQYGDQDTFETVTMKKAEGAWRGVGYYVVPANKKQ